MKVHDNIIHSFLEQHPNWKKRGVFDVKEHVVLEMENILKKSWTKHELSFFDSMDKQELYQHISIWIRNEHEKELDLEEIFRYAEIENIKILMAAGIMNLEDLVMLKDVATYTEPKELRNRISILRFVGIEDYQSIVSLREVLRYWDSHSLKSRTDALKKSYITNPKDIMASLLRTQYIEQEFDSLPDIYFRGKCRHTSVDNDAILALYWEYKIWLTKSSPFLWSHKVEWPINLIDQHVSTDLSSMQHSGDKIVLWEESFFYLSRDKWASPEKQLWANRIFAPFMPMTHVVRLIENNQQQHVSLDADNSQFRPLFGFYDENQALLFRMIYEYLTQEGDRNKHQTSAKKDHNIIGNIMIDFDDMGNDSRNANYFKPEIYTASQKQELANLIVFWRSYIASHCQSEIERISKISTILPQSLRDELSWNRWIICRAESMTALNIMSRLLMQRPMNKEQRDAVYAIDSQIMN